MKKTPNISVAIREFSTRMRKNVDEVAKRSVSKFAVKLIERSPVKTGNYVYNWRFSAGSVPAGELTGVDPGKRKVLGRLLSDINRYMGTGKVAYLANTALHAQRIEYGWSQQAPSGVLRITIAEWPSMVNESVAEVRRGAKR